MKALLIANAINIILDPILILGIDPFPKMCVVAAAIATTAGRSFVVCYQFYYLLDGKALVKLTRENFTVKFVLIRSDLHTSAEGMFQFIIGSCSWVFLAMLIAESGTEAVLSNSAAIRICIFTIIAAWDW